MLGAIGPAAHRAVPALIKLTKEGNASARSHAGIALSKIGPVKNIDIVEPIAAMIGDYSAVVRERALESLGRLGPKAEAALPIVQKTLRKATSNNRVHAAVAAYRITGDAKEPVEILTELTSELDFELDALQALGKIGPPAKACVPTIMKMLDARDPDKRFEIVQTLKQVAITEPVVINKLNRLAKSDPDADVRRVATLFKSAEEQPKAEEPAKEKSK